MNNTRRLGSIGLMGLLHLLVVGCVASAQGGKVADRSPVGSDSDAAAIHQVAPHWPAWPEQANDPDAAAIHAAVRQLVLAAGGDPARARLDCSTSAQPLLMQVLASAMAEPTCWAMIPEDGSWRLRPGQRLAWVNMLIRWAAPDAPPPPPERDVDPASAARWRYLANALAVTGTHDAYAGVIDGTRDLAVIARLPSDDERALMAERGVELDIVPVARDAFVFIVHPTLTVDGLTLEEVRGIFTGRITNWQQVGGPSQPITPYTRERNSGSQELMIWKVMQDRPFAEHARGDSIVMGMGGPMSAMAVNQTGISYSVHYYVRYMSPALTPGRSFRAASPFERERQQPQAEQPAVRVELRSKFLAIDGVAPSPATIADGSYPLIEPVYLVTRRDLEPGSAAGQLRDWLLSPAGQRVIARSGYVPAERDR